MSENILRSGVHYCPPYITDMSELNVNCSPERYSTDSVIMSTSFKGGRHIVLLRLALAVASGLTLRHPLLDFFWGAPKYDPSYMEIIFHR